MSTWLVVWIVLWALGSKGFSRIDVNTNGGAAHDTLAGQFLGVTLKSGDGFGVPAESYEFEHKRLAWETIPPLLDRGSPLRSAHLRDPVGPQIQFATGESSTVRTIRDDAHHLQMGIDHRTQLAELVK